MDIQLQLNPRSGNYSESIFSLRMGGGLVLENVTIEAIFNELESCYEPEYKDFSIEVWKNGRRETIL